MTTSLEDRIPTLRIDYDDEGESDSLIEVEVGDPENPRGIDLHIDPRTTDVVTCCLSPPSAWALARELARAAAAWEGENR